MLLEDGPLAHFQICSIAVSARLRQFLEFLAEHLGRAPSLKDLVALKPADVRAFLAAAAARR